MLTAQRVSPTCAVPSAVLIDFCLAPCFTAALRFDLLIKNGLLVDPAQNLRAPYDVAIKRNLAAAVDRDIPLESAA